MDSPQADATGTSGKGNRQVQPNALNDSATGPYKVNSLRIDPHADPMAGAVTWDPWRSLWNGGMLLAALVLAPRYFTWGAFAVFVGLLGLTMCTGHSVGFHRRLIHRTFQCPKWLEHLMVWSGTLVGMQGPFWVIQSHDFRDWAQRQPNCHPYLRHGQGMLKDAFWNLHCRLKLEHPPGFDPGPGIGDDRFYQFLQRTWMLQQLPLATVALSIGRSAVAGVGSLRARHHRSVDALVRRLHLSFAWARKAGMSTTVLSRRTTFRGRPSLPWERAGTTIIMRFPLRRVTACIRDSSTSDSCSFVC